MFIVTPDTVANPGALADRSAPGPVLQRFRTPWPRALVVSRAFWRLAFELPFLRYSLLLMPFPVAMLIWPEVALPISGAPLVMFLVVLYVEGNVLSLPTPARRAALIDRAEAERALDTLAVRGRAVLTRIAAGRAMTAGVLVLVVEQPLMAVVPPLTAVSVQDAEGTVLRLDAAERAALAGGLFGGGLDARLLLRVNLSENRGLRMVTLEAGTISAHARLAALARARG
jgi:hypothetical protein